MSDSSCVCLVLNSSLGGRDWEANVTLQSPRRKPFTITLTMCNILFSNYYLYLPNYCINMGMYFLILPIPFQVAGNTCIMSSGESSGFGVVSVSVRRLTSAVSGRRCAA